MLRRCQKQSAAAGADLQFVLSIFINPLGAFLSAARIAQPRQRVFVYCLSKSKTIITGDEVNLDT
jgi:hypothetical protein